MKCSRSKKGDKDWFNASSPQEALSLLKGMSSKILQTTKKGKKVFQAPGQEQFYDYNNKNVDTGANFAPNGP